MTRDLVAIRPGRLFALAMCAALASATPRATLLQTLPDRPPDLDRLIADAEARRSAGTADSLRESARLFAEALAGAAAAADDAREATALVGLGRTVDAQGDKNRAIGLFERALPLLHAAGLRTAESYALNYGALAHSFLGAHRTGIEWLTRALALADGSGDRRLTAITLNNFGVLYYSLGDKTRSLDFYSRALDQNVAAGNVRGEAQTLRNIGTLYDSMGDSEQALAFLLRSLPLQERLAEPRDLAGTLNNIGAVYFRSDDGAKAIEYYERALAGWRRAGDRSGEAATLHNIANAYEIMGEFQVALDFYNQALPLHHAVHYQFGEANTLTNLGRLYAVLGDPERSLEMLTRALPLHRAVANGPSEAVTLLNIGIQLAEQGHADRALSYYDQALPLARAAGDRSGEAGVLTDRARADSALGRIGAARTAFAQAIDLQRAVASPRGEARALAGLGELEVAEHNAQAAIALYDRALGLVAPRIERPAEAYLLYSRALANRAAGRLESALADADAALEIVETVRRTVASPDLRSSYFATVRRYYELAVDVLMQLDRARPAEGFAARAFAVSERGRARALLDVLAEAGGDIRAGVDPVLLERERTFERAATARASHLAKLVAGRHTQEEVDALDRQLSLTMRDLEQVEAAIRTASPRYAALTQPEPLSLEAAQREVGDDTVVLEYALGEPRSYLWVVSSTATVTFELASRSEIDAKARAFYDRLRDPATTQAELERVGHSLATLILDPAAGSIGRKCLVFVTDGALQYVPLAALPIGRPGAGYRPLILDHETANLPSLSSLARLRAARRPRPSRTLAVIADPVFDAEDARVSHGIQRPPAGGATRSAEADDWADGFRLPRVVGSRREAAGILELVPPAKRRQALDFEANRATAFDPALADYRIVHFATHALLNSRRPALTGIVLSMVDRSGRPQDGFLRLHDLFNLNLPADLVVLSACQTALGRDVRGEGLVGMTRGFMYAGAQRVVASLWTVDDRGTAELMKRFYAAMLGPRRATPAAALREAQLALAASQTLRAPYYWAAFTLQGEWR